MAVYVDCDEIKERIPEYKTLQSTNPLDAADNSKRQDLFKKVTKAVKYNGKDYMKKLVKENEKKLKRK
jgi:hypothetical protein